MTPPSRRSSSTHTANHGPTSSPPTWRHWRNFSTTSNTAPAPQLRSSPRPKDSTPGIRAPPKLRLRRNPPPRPPDPPPAPAVHPRPPMTKSPHPHRRHPAHLPVQGSDRVPDKPAARSRPMTGANPPLTPGVTKNAFLAHSHEPRRSSGGSGHDPGAGNAFTARSRVRISGGTLEDLSLTLPDSSTRDVHVRIAGTPPTPSKLAIILDHPARTLLVTSRPDKAITDAAARNLMDLITVAPATVIMGGIHLLETRDPGFPTAPDGHRTRGL